MNIKSRRALIGGILVVSTSLAACSQFNVSEPSSKPKTEGPPMPLSIALTQVGDIPNKGSEVEQMIEKYTQTKLNIQWIPGAAYTDKINIMIASNEMPILVKVDYTPTIIASIQSDLFWEIGPMLKDYKNLSAQSRQYYSNIAVNGKIYGVPNFREMNRAAFIYRKDWMDNLGLQQPKTSDEWYNVLKAFTLNDPDKNGKNDTFGLLLFKKYNEGQASTLTRIAVSWGGPNKWSIEQGQFVPEFMSQPYNDVLKLFRRLYAEKLINQDFAVLDQMDAEKQFDSGRAGIRVAVAQNAKSQLDRLSKVEPKAQVEVEPMIGLQGIRVAGEAGNHGFYVIPKSSVKTEADVEKVLSFLDKMMDPEMAKLLLRGVENKHFVKSGDKTEFKDFTAFQREVKPYRDNLPQLEGYNVAPLTDTPLGEKGQRIVENNDKYAVLNPALNLQSPTYSEIGKELDQMIGDAQTNYIMGKIDDAGWLAEIDHWKKAGGSKIMEEYKANYEKTDKKS